MDWLTELTTLLPPPSGVAPIENWAAIEADLGTPLPEDFKTYVDLYGSAYVGGFFWANSADTAVEAKRRTEAYAIQARFFPKTFSLPVFPLQGSLLVWGATDNGDDLGWIASGAPESWPVAVLRHEDGQPEVFQMRFGTFMSGVVRGKIRPDAFPTDVFDALPMTLWAQ